MPRAIEIKTALFTAKRQPVQAGFADSAALSGQIAAAVAATGLDPARAAKAASFAGKKGQSLDLLGAAADGPDRVLVLGTAETGKGAPSPTLMLDRGGVLGARLLGLKADKVSVLLDGDGFTPEAVAELAAGMRLRAYGFDKYKSKKGDEDKDSAKPLIVTLHVADKSATDKAIARRMAVAEGTLLARDLVNEPANTLGPVEFADIAAGLADHGVEIDMLNREEMTRLGMHSLLSVAAGSAREPRLVVMRWMGGKKKDAPIAFVGKGVTFDTGGISIKPAASMEDMKGDMGGAAAVTGLIKALALRKAKVNAIGVIGLVENMPDANATRPGDIVTAMSGTTIEIINTDAEGRLVLADALWYTQDKYKPRAMINLATLTGAILVALGNEHAGLFSNNDDLATQLLSAGLASGEKLWRLPLGPAYDKMIESKFADIKNTGGRYAGSITAAQFLQRFVNDVPWAHLDIAGTAFGAPASDISTGWAPGYGVALLDRLIADHFEG